MVPTLLVMLTLAMLYWFPIRRWMSRWGATRRDLRRVMAGDDLLGDRKGRPHDERRQVQTLIGGCGGEEALLLPRGPEFDTVISGDSCGRHK